MIFPNIAEPQEGVVSRMSFCWRSVLTGTGSSVALSIILALPLLVLIVSMEIELGNGDICIPSHSAGFGISLEQYGQLHCKLVLSQVALFWGILALAAAPVAALAIYTRRHLKWARTGSFGRVSKAGWPQEQRYGRNLYLAGGATLLLAVAWILTDLAAGDPYTHYSLCERTEAGRELWSYQSNGNEAVYCRVDVSGAISRLGIVLFKAFPIGAAITVLIVWWLARRTDPGRVQQEPGAPGPTANPMP